MSNLRRYYSDGQSYFVTCVTYRRQPLLVSHHDLFWSAVEEVRSTLAFDLGPWVVLPDHFHWIITPQGTNLSDIMRRTKVIVAARYRSRLHVSEGRFWQNRFWDHVIRNENDLTWHANYIHFNPVKHGLSADPERYAFSSLKLFLEGGQSIPVWSEIAKYDGKHGE